MAEMLKRSTICVRRDIETVLRHSDGAFSRFERFFARSDADIWASNSPTRSYPRGFLRILARFAGTYLFKNEFSDIGFYLRFF